MFQPGGRRICTGDLSLYFCLMLSSGGKIRKLKTWILSKNFLFSNLLLGKNKSWPFYQWRYRYNREKAYTTPKGHCKQERLLSQWPNVQFLAETASSSSSSGLRLTIITIGCVYDQLARVRVPAVKEWLLYFVADVLKKATALVFFCITIMAEGVLWITRYVRFAWGILCSARCTLVMIVGILHRRVVIGEEWAALTLHSMPFQ